ncbi:hypothetical protein HOY80DRAFT_44434 [Tuber brumale]|nr:hypothetical protein HOY80DRAFT_44434 [Tuber brumale]
MDGILRFPFGLHFPPSMKEEIPYLSQRVTVASFFFLFSFFPPFSGPSRYSTTLSRACCSFVLGTCRDGLTGALLQLRNVPIHCQGKPPAGFGQLIDQRTQNIINDIFSRSACHCCPYGGFSSHNFFFTIFLGSSRLFLVGPVDEGPAYLVFVHQRFCEPLFAIPAMEYCMQVSVGLPFPPRSPIYPRHSASWQSSASSLVDQLPLMHENASNIFVNAKFSA